MPTRLFTSFMMPNNESLTEDRVKYWVDVQEDYEKVFDQVFPLQPAASSLEARERFWFTKLEDGQRFACNTGQIMGFEEITN
jgi:hypothetical protein